MSEGGMGMELDCDEGGMGMELIVMRVEWE